MSLNKQNSLDDKQLIEFCKRGVSSAQTQLYRRYKNHWFTICLRYVNKREDAMDVLQNALIKIYTKLSQFDEALGSFKSWSSRIVVNESIMFQRKYWNSHEVQGLNMEILEREDNNSKAISNLTLEELTKTIQNLPQGYRMVFNLFTIDGFSHREIASLLSITEGTSKSQLFKAKSILRKKLQVTFKEELRMTS